MIQARIETRPKDWWRRVKRSKPEVIWVPDPQVAAGVPIHHLEACGRYIAHQKPDYILFGNDWFDFPSLNFWDREKPDFRMRDYMEDICVGTHALDVFFAPIYEELKRCRWWKPVFIFVEGNHDFRARRAAKEDKRFNKALVKPWNIVKDVADKLHRYGVRLKWMYLEQIINIDGVHYSHYFCNPRTGKMIGGTAQNKATRLKFSFTMGHIPGKEVWHEPLSNGRVIRGIVAGSFYLHHEGYHGPQASDYWRGVMYKHEVREGTYDLMEVSIDYLLRKWTNKEIIADPTYRFKDFGWPSSDTDPISSQGDER